MLGIAVATATLTGPGQTIGVAVFIDHLARDLSLSRPEISGAYLVGTLSGAALLPAVGRAIDRHGVRPAQLIIAVAFGLALVNMSLVDGLVWLAVGFAGIRFLGQGALSLVATITVSVRFVRNRGTAIGAFATSSSALMALVPLSLSFVIGLAGWRATWLLAAVVVVSTVAPMAWFGLRQLDPPYSLQRGGSSDEGDSLDLGVPLGGEPSNVVVSQLVGYDRRAAMKTTQFWLLAAVSGAAGMLGTGLTFHQIDLLGAAGLSPTAAAALFIPQVAGSAIAGLVAGYLSDRAGGRWLPAIGLVLLISAHWLAAVVEPGFVVVVYAITLGAMGGSIRTTTAALLPAWFGTSNLGSIQGSLTLFGVGASALGPITLAVAESVAGSYPPAVLALSLIPAVLLVVALKPSVNRAPEPRGATLT